MTRVSAIVVSWNGESHLGSCLDALLEQVGPDDEIVVVDNGSADGSATLVRQQYPQVRLIENQCNLGLAGGYNVGVRAAQGEYLLLVNQNVVVDVASQRFSALAGQCPTEAAAPGTVKIVLPPLGYAVCAAQ